MDAFPIQYLPRYGVDPATQFEILHAQFGDGYSQRGRAGINNKAQTWRLTFVLSAVDIDAIVRFIDERVGVTAFLWRPQRQIDIAVICTDYRGPRQLGPNAWQLVCTFQRVYDL